MLNYALWDILEDGLLRVFATFEQDFISVQVTLQVCQWPKKFSYNLKVDLDNNIWKTWLE